MSDDTRCIEWQEAVALAREGFAVFPVHVAKTFKNLKGGVQYYCTCGKSGIVGEESESRICKGKHPADVESFSRQSTTDINRINNYGLRWGSRGIGIHCGKSYKWVLDIDGEEGYEELEKLTAKYGDMPKTREVLTGSGGMHYYFSAWVDRIASGKLTPHIDIKGNRGNAYVVAPPTLHHSGKRYRYIERCSPVDAPEWLVNLATERTYTGEARRLSTEQIATRRTTEIAIERILSAEHRKCLHDEGSVIRGSHPVHGSKNGRNFAIDREYNRWYCNRCESSGGLFELSAMLSGICKCEDFKRNRTENPLKGELFIRAVGAALVNGITKDELRRHIARGV